MLTEAKALRIEMEAKIDPSIRADLRDSALIGLLLAEVVQLREKATKEHDADCFCVSCLSRSSRRVSA